MIYIRNPSGFLLIIDNQLLKISSIYHQKERKSFVRSSEGIIASSVSINIFFIHIKKYRFFRNLYHMWCNSNYLN